jgi:PIN domain nuclease of toxin-antitoxin system
VIAAILVDTHLVLWARIAPERLTAGERRALDDARSCYVSAVSLWEIAILMALDRVARDQRLLVVSRRLRSASGVARSLQGFGRAAAAAS